MVEHGSGGGRGLRRRKGVISFTSKNVSLFGRCGNYLSRVNDE